MTRDIVLPGSALDNPLIEKPCSPLEAAGWLWLQLTGCSGKLQAQETKLAQLWGWSRGRVRRFLQQLETEGRLNRKPKNGGNVLLSFPSGTKVASDPKTVQVPVQVAVQVEKPEVQKNEQLAQNGRQKTVQVAVQVPVQVPEKTPKDTGTEFALSGITPRPATDIRSSKRSASAFRRTQSSLSSKASGGFADKTRAGLPEQKKDEKNILGENETGQRWLFGHPECCHCRACQKAVFSHWQGYPQLTKHQRLTRPMRDAVVKVLKAGYTAEQVRLAITRYAQLCEAGTAPGRNRWTLIELLTRHKMTYLDKLLDERFKGFSADVESGNGKGSGNGSGGKLPGWLKAKLYRFSAEANQLMAGGHWEGSEYTAELTRRVMRKARAVGLAVEVDQVTKLFVE